MEQGEQDFILLPGGVHLWGPKPKLLGSVPENIIERESAGYALWSMDNPNWRKIATDTMVVMGDVPDQALKILAVTAEKLDEMLQREIGGPSRKYIYKIRIFQDRSHFCSYANNCGAANAHSLYNPRTGEMAVHFGPETGQEEFQQTFAHEFTHAYMDQVYRVTEPLWFAEGMAEYFSLVKWTSRGYKPTKKNWRAAMHFGSGLLIPLREILKASREDIYGITFYLYYANCWALIHFLMHKHPEIVEGLLNKQRIDISPLEDEYAKYVKKLMGL